jgi:hypothetical protein
MLVVGIAAGSGAGFVLKAPAEECTEEPCEAAAEETDAKGDDANTAEPNYIRLQNQFVVPVVKDDRVRSMVVLGLSLETEPGSEDLVYSREPKIRDAFLRVLFDHAHIGGFDGNFTESSRLSLLRVALLEAAQAVIGPGISDILITDIARQEF